MGTGGAALGRWCNGVCCCDVHVSVRRVAVPVGEGGMGVGGVGKLVGWGGGEHTD